MSEQDRMVKRRWELVFKQVSSNLTDKEWKELIELRENTPEKAKHGIRENRKSKLIMDDDYE